MLRFSARRGKSEIKEILKILQTRNSENIAVQKARALKNKLYRSPTITSTAS